MRPLTSLILSWLLISGPGFASSISNGGGSSTISPLFANLNDVTVTAAASATTIVDPSGHGSLVLPANYFTTGKTLTIDVGGVYTTTATPGTFFIRLNLSGNQITISSVSTLVASQTNAFWYARFTVTCRAGGASGTLQGNGHLVMDDGGGLALDVNSGINGQLIGFDLTTSRTLDVLVDFGSAGQSITAKSLVVYPF